MANFTTLRRVTLGIAFAGLGAAVAVPAFNALRSSGEAAKVLEKASNRAAQLERAEQAAGANQPSAAKPD
jgi:hypothetical protein